MSKAPSKKRGKKGQRSPNIPQISTVRPRLDALWSDETLPSQENATLLANLESVAAGIKPPQLLPVLLTAYQAAPSPAQERLDEVLPGWLAQHRYESILRQLITRNVLDSEQAHVALAWLEATGSDTADLVAHVEQSSFHSAYYSRDATDQAELFFFWYTDHRRNHVCAFDVLIDHNPPWNGALKDATITHKRKPEKAIERLFEQWTIGRRTPLEEMDAATAQRVLVEAIECNRKEDIRLPAFFGIWRDEFVEHVLSLPPAPDAPSPLSAEAFDALMEQGRSPEELLDYEDEVGYYVRSPDGSSQFILHHPDDEEEEDDDEGEDEPEHDAEPERDTKM